MPSDKEALARKEQQLLRDLADLTVEQVLADPEFMRDIENGLAAIRRGEDGTPLREVLKEWQNRRGSST